jgi:uncharacterized protein YuzE
MKHEYLEVTYRRGKPLAAYLYLPRSAGAKVARTADAGPGLRVDFDAAGTPMGIEITAPSAVSARDVNALLARLGQPDLPAEDLAPLRAA